MSNPSVGRVIVNTDADPVDVDGRGQNYVLSQGDVDTHELLGLILKELRIMNLHLAQITDEEPLETDIEQDDLR